MINKAMVLGRVGKIETRDLTSGKKVTNISLVTSKKFTHNGEKKEKITWHNVTLFDKLAGIAESYVAVGDLLYVEGEMDTQKYQGKDGLEKQKFLILASEIKLMPKAKPAAAVQQALPIEDGPIFDDDIPF
jgi:single-strand DNA-binding protein